MSTQTRTDLDQWALKAKRKGEERNSVEKCREKERGKIKDYKHSGKNNKPNANRNVRFD